MCRPSTFLSLHSINFFIDASNIAEFFTDTQTRYRSLQSFVQTYNHLTTNCRQVWDMPISKDDVILSLTYYSTYIIRSTVEFSSFSSSVDRIIVILYVCSCFSFCFCIFRVRSVLQLRIQMKNVKQIDFLLSSINDHRHWFFIRVCFILIWCRL